MLTTADLPGDMQFMPEDPATRAVRGSNLALSVICRHGDPGCPVCIVAAARRLVEATDTAS